MVDTKKGVALSEAVSKLEFAEDNMILNEEFKKNVAIPYFKDIYKDLVSQSDAKSKGFNKITLLNYSQLPGIIGERLFAVLDLKGQEYVDLREFVHGFFKIYYSNLETKLKLTFDIYDFDKDGFIFKEDVRLVLSHMPIEQSLDIHQEHEGKFTSAGGGSQVFLDRIQSQEEIHKLVEEVFADKQKLNFEDY